MAGLPMRRRCFGDTLRVQESCDYGIASSVRCEGSFEAEKASDTKCYRRSSSDLIVVEQASLTDSSLPVIVLRAASRAGPA